MHLDLVELLRCPECAHPFRVRVLSPAGPDADAIATEAVLTCQGCSRWCRVEGGIADLLPAALADGSRRAAFARRHGLEAAGPGSVSPLTVTGAPLPDDGPGLRQKRTQQSFYGGTVDHYESHVVSQPFFQALDALTVLPWMDRLGSGSRVLDLCAGTGRVSRPLAARGHRVIAVDFAEPMLLEAGSRLQEAGTAERTDLVLADAEALPLRDGCLDAVLCHGSLHHLPKPERAVTEAGRLLRPGGRWFALVSNRSPLRWVFHLAQRLTPQWVEKTRGLPRQDEASMRNWCEAAGIDVRVRYTAYLLPHFLNHRSSEEARDVLERTDRMFARMPILRQWAGFFCAEGVRRG